MGREQGKGRNGLREFLGEDGQSGCDMLCETAGLSLRLGGKTKLKTLWAKRGWVIRGGVEQALL